MQPSDNAADPRAAEPSPGAIPTEGAPVKVRKIGASAPGERELQIRAEQLAADALSRIRTAAEKWGATTAAVFTALGFATFFQGRNQITALAEVFEILTGAALLAAFLLALVSIVLAGLAAQGNPRRMVVTGPELRTIEAEEANRARRLLTWSRTSVACAGALVIGVLGLLWFAPTDDAVATQRVLVLVRAGDLICGPLETQGDGRLEVRTSDGVEAIRVSDVVSVSAVASCPGEGS